MCAEDIRAWAPLFAALVAAISGFIVVSRNAKAQLQLQYRLKLLERAHAAIDQVTLEAFAAIDAHQRWARARRTGSETEDMSSAAYRARFALRRPSSDLPPDLYRAYDTLRDAYDDLDTAAGVVHDALGHPDGAAAPIERFIKALPEWQTAVREWQRANWSGSRMA